MAFPLHQRISIDPQFQKPLTEQSFGIFPREKAGGMRYRMAPAELSYTSTLKRSLGRHPCGSKPASMVLLRCDPLTGTGQEANRRDAWRASNRVQKAACLPENLHPRRFRKTLATFAASVPRWSLGMRNGSSPSSICARTGFPSETPPRGVDRRPRVDSSS